MAIAVITSFSQQCDLNGVPVSGAKIHVYAAETTTPLTLYSDDDLNNAAANPIICDADGRHAMRYIAAGTAYKIAVTTSAGAAIYTRDNIDPGVPAGSGALPIAAGGTGATTAGGARTNLGVPSVSEVAGNAADIAALQSTLTGTGRTRIAVGDTSQRPAVPGEGDIRYNTDLEQYEAYDGNLASFAKLVTVPALPADMSAGFFIGYTYAEQTSNTAISGTTPIDDTIPQITEGAQIVSLTTPVPQSTSSKFLLIYTGEMSNGNGDLQQVVHLHKTGQTDAIASRHIRMTATADIKEANLFYIDSPSSSSAVTYSVRTGNASGLGVYVNGNASGRLYGGSSRATLIAIEIKG